MYPSLRVPTHPFSVLGLSAWGSAKGKFCTWKYHGCTATWCEPCGACSGNQPCFLAQGATYGHTFLGKFCLQSRTKLIFIDCECWCLIVLFAIPTTVVLLQFKGVFGCGCPIFVRASQKIIPAWQLWYRALRSTSAADAMTNCKIIVLTWKAPFNWIGLPSFGIHLRKKCPHALLRAFASDR